MEKLNKKHQELIDLKNHWINTIKGLTTEQLNHKKSEDEWSLTQVFSHIIESESGTNKYINYKLKEVESLENTGLKSTLGSKALNMALKSKNKYKAPSVVASPANNLSFDEINDAWNNARKYFANMVESFPKEATSKAIFKHPKAGYFNIYQTLDFLINHLKHHQMQIDRLKSEL